MAADLLDRFVRVGYPPDILDCAIAVRDVLRIADAVGEMELIRDRIRPSTKVLKRYSDSGHMPGTSARLQEYRAEAVNLAASAGVELGTVPVLRLLEVVQRHMVAAAPTADLEPSHARARPGGFFSDNEHSRAGATPRICYRSYVRGTHQVHARLLARCLELDSSRILESIPITAEQRRVAQIQEQWFQVEGAVGSTDLRVVGGPSAMMEVLIRAVSIDTALALLERLVEDLGDAVPRAVESVGLLVRERLSGSLDRRYAVRPPRKASCYRSRTSVHRAPSVSVCWRTCCTIGAWLVPGRGHYRMRWSGGRPLAQSGEESVPVEVLTDTPLQLVREIRPRRDQEAAPAPEPGIVPGYGTHADELVVVGEWTANVPGVRLVQRVETGAIDAPVIDAGESVDLEAEGHELDHDR
jgi:hypothetical protein